MFARRGCLQAIPLLACTQFELKLGQSGMANSQGQKPGLDCYVVIHVATTCDEHGVFVTKDSAEVIELGWILLDATSCDEVEFSSLILGTNILTK